MVLYTYPLRLPSYISVMKEGAEISDRGDMDGTEGRDARGFSRWDGVAMDYPLFRVGP
jgi:hypothetical protein